MISRRAQCCDGSEVARKPASWRKPTPSPLSAIHGGEAYGEARWRELDVILPDGTTHAGRTPEHWRRVALIVARMTGRRVGGDPATRMLGTALGRGLKPLGHRELGLAASRKYQLFAVGQANGPKRPVCRRYRWCRNLPLVEGPHSARRSCRRVRRPRGRRQPPTGSPATAQALSVARRGGEPAEFALDEPGEGERRPVFVFGADDLHADRQAIRDRDRNDGRRQPAGRRGIGPDQ